MFWEILRCILTDTSIITALNPYILHGGELVEPTRSSCFVLDSADAREDFSDFETETRIFFISNGFYQLSYLVSGVGKYTLFFL